MNNEWDEYAQDWDINPEVQHYANNAFAQLIKLCDLKGKRVLDFGCGTGILTQLISEQAKQVVAIDPSPKMIECLTAKLLKNVTPVCDYLNPEVYNQHQGFSEKFDVIVASSVCAFLPDYEQTLALLKTGLAPNGLFVQWDWLAESEGAGKGLSKARVEYALNSNHFREVTLSVPFTMNNEQPGASVLMAHGKS